MILACNDCGEPIDPGDITEGPDGAILHVKCAPWIVDGEVTQPYEPLKRPRIGGMVDKNQTTIGNGKVEYHRNGVGGAGYYTIAFDTPEEHDDAPRRMLAIIPDEFTTDDDGWLLPKGTHLEHLLVIDPLDVAHFAHGNGEMNNWRGADYWSHIIMDILWERQLNTWPDYPHPALVKS